MTAVGQNFMGRISPKITRANSLGEALSRVVERLVGGTPAIVREFNVDKKTAANIREGRAGGAVLMKALLARQSTHDDAWDFADAIIEQVLGETRDQYEQRKLAALHESIEHAKRTAEARRERRSYLAARSRAVDETLGRSAA